MAHRSHEGEPDGWWYARRVPGVRERGERGRFLRRKGGPPNPPQLKGPREGTCRQKGVSFRCPLTALTGESGGKCGSSRWTKGTGHETQTEGRGRLLGVEKAEVLPTVSGSRVVMVAGNPTTALLTCKKEGNRRKGGGKGERGKEGKKGLRFCSVRCSGLLSQGNPWARRSGARVARGLCPAKGWEPRGNLLWCLRW